MSRLLYEVSPLDPIVFVGVSALLAAAGFVASLIPARRATPWIRSSRSALSRHASDLEAGDTIGIYPDVISGPDSVVPDRAPRFTIALEGDDRRARPELGAAPDAVFRRLPIHAREPCVGTRLIIDATMWQPTAEVPDPPADNDAGSAAAWNTVVAAAQRSEELSRRMPGGVVCRRLEWQRSARPRLRIPMPCSPGIPTTAGRWRGRPTNRGTR